MKKSVMVIFVVGLVAAVSFGAYAHGGYGRGYGRGNYGGPMMGGGYGPGPMMGGGYGPGPMMGAWGENRGGYGYCGGGYGPSQQGRPGWNAPGQTENAPQLVTEATVKENAEAYIAQYLPGYTIERIEKDEWRPMYFLTLKGENGVEQQMWVRGFDGQVMHVIPQPTQ